MDRHQSIQAVVSSREEAVILQPVRQPSSDVVTKSEHDRSKTQESPSFTLAYTYSNSPFLNKAGRAPEVERHLHSEYISRHFHEYGDAHGAIESRVLLWGFEGNGKRQFALRYANEFAPSRQRQILWIEASLSHTFIRDYRLAYQVMTRKLPPTGTNLAGLLYLIQTTLSECREKWFMVVLDLGNHLTRPNANESGFDLTSYLPRGQILITHSTDFYFGNSEHWQERVCPDMELQSLSASIHFSSVSYEEACRYITTVFPSVNTDAAMTKTTLRGLEQHFITMVIACATSFLQRISISRYSRLLDRTMTVSQHGVTTMPDHQLPYFKFSIAMRLFMETLRDVNRLAGTLLAMLPVVSHRDIPVRLLMKLRPFHRRPHEFEDVLELLTSCCIITLRTTADGERFIDVNPMIHAWLDKKAREQFWDGDTDFEFIVLDWIDIMDAALPEMADDTNGYQYWSLLHLVVPLLEVSRESDIRALSLLSLLRKTCTFLGEHLIMPVITGHLLARAQDLCTVIRDEFGGNNEQAIVIHRERSKMLFLLGNAVLAQKEMRAAQNLLDTAVLDDSERRVLQESVFDERNSQLLQQNRTQEAAVWLRKVFLEGSATTSEPRLAKLHHWLACTASHDLEANIYALQHSHMAMCYWSKLSESRRWGFEHFPQLAWADTHAGFLMQLDKSRGALVFLPKIFERHIEQCPPYHENIWRLAFCLVREYSFVFEYEAAEMIAYKALSRADHKLLRGAPLTWAIMMLRGLAGTLYRDGKYLEAEGIFRWCLDCLEYRSPPAILGQSGTNFSCLNIWGELVQVLLVQGKMREAKAARQLSIHRGYDGLKHEEWLAAKEPYHDLSRQYGRALRAAQDRVENLYNAEDWMLDMGRPGSFHLSVRMFGDPFDRLRYGNEDFRTDLYPSQNYCKFRDSKILPLIGYIDDDVPSDKPKTDTAQIDPLWDIVFQPKLSSHIAQGQTQISEYFRWCGCRRRRGRAFSTTSRKVWTVPRGTDDNVRSRHDASRFHQTLLTTYFVRQIPHPTVSCNKDCPCVTANINGKIISDQIASEKLFLYRPCKPEVRELEHQYYLEDLARYRRQYGPRPALPYGFGFYSTWRTPEYAAEANGDAALQHELFWAPDFVLRGDAASLSEFYGQEENYLMTNPALMTVDGTGIPIFDLPNIRITAHKLGEKVKANVDRLTNNWRKDWAQSSISSYFEYIEPRRQRGHRHRRSSAISDDCLSPITDTRDKRKRNRHSHKVRKDGQENESGDKIHHVTSSATPDSSLDVTKTATEPRAATENTASECQPAARSLHDLEDGPSRGRRSTRHGSKIQIYSQSKSPSSTSSYSSDEASQTESETIPVKTEKLHVFNINSIHSGGSIFDPGSFSRRKLNRMSAMMARHAGRLGDTDSDAISSFSNDSIDEQEDEDQDEFYRSQVTKPENSAETNCNSTTISSLNIELMDLNHHIPHSLVDIDEDVELSSNNLHVNCPSLGVQDVTIPSERSTSGDLTDEPANEDKGKGKEKEQS